MQVQVKYFAAIREALGTSGEPVQTQASTLSGLRDELIARGEAYALALARGKAVRVALNQVMQDETALLKDGCEVAFFPPVTGG
jgi:molybdopterin synthase sulfur carrier subunit